MDFTDQLSQYSSQYDELKNKFYTKRDDLLALASEETKSRERGGEVVQSVYMCR